MKNWTVIAAMAIVAVALAACGGSDSTSGGGGGGDTTTGLAGATSVTGTVLSASGDPVPGTTVYLPGTTVSSQVSKATRSYEKAVTASDGTTCEDPPSADGSVAACCTDQTGAFNCDTSAVTTNPTQIVFVRGSLRMVQTLSCTADPCALSSTATTFGGGTTTWPRIAVVTGTYDRMEDVLAKLADSNRADDTNGQYGRVDSTSGVFVYGSEYGTNMTIIAGGGTIYPIENADVLTYDTWDQYLDGTKPLVSTNSDGVSAPVFDVVFINCGNAFYENYYLTAAAKILLQNYVNAGGRLYVTDLSYDFVEQPFPQVMKFEGDPDDPNTPGGLGVAETGTTGLIVDAAVNDSGMLSWLGTVTVNQHDASTPGNPDNDCSGSYTQRTGALTSNNLIPLGDFLSGWAHMVGAHTGYSPTIWISSGAGVTFDDLANRPLTVSMGIGSNSGKIFYSSYHTANNCATTNFWPQERVLQYLIFEAF